MANFGNVGSNISELSLQDSIPALKDAAGEFGFRGKAREDDFMSQLDKMTKAMRERQEEQRPEIKLDVFDLGASLIDETAVQNPLDKLLGQAKELVAEERYQEALDLLQEFLRQQPAHHEAIYLLAYCQSGLTDCDAALRTLLPLRRARLDNAVAERVAALKMNIRAQMYLSIVLENFVLLQAGLYDVAISQLQYVVELDPENGMYHFMLAGSLMGAGQLEDAIAAVNDGLNNSTTEERQILQGLKQQIEHAYVAGKMRQARGYFKNGRYGKARSALNGVEPLYRRHPLYLVFATYLAKLDGGMLGFLKRKNASDVAPEGKRDDVEALYFFLVEDELARAQSLIYEKKYAQAESLLKSAMGYTHNFPFVHYLYGGCIYSRVAQQITGQDVPSLDDVIGDLEISSRHAKIGTADAAIGDAEMLLSTINETHKYLCSVRNEAQARQAEISAVNSAIREFEDIMKAGDSGISSVAQYRSISERMNNLKKKLPAVKKQVASKDIKESVAHLEDAVKRNLEQLEQIGAQIEEENEINALMKEFEEILKSGQGGINSLSQYRSINDRMNKLTQKVAGVKRRVASQDGKDSLKQLEEAVVRNLEQLKEIGESVGESETVQTYFDKFTRKMESITSSGGIRSHSELSAAKDYFRSLKRDAEAAKRNLSSAGARNSIDQVIAAVDAVLKQLEG